MNKQLYESLMKNISYSIDNAINEMAKKDPQQIFLKLYNDVIKKHKNNKEQSFIINLYNIYDQIRRTTPDKDMLWADDDQFIKDIHFGKWWQIPVAGYTLSVNNEINLGQGYHSIYCPIKILFLAKPCNEFLKLNALLQKYGCKPIKDDTLLSQWVDGKRDDIFGATDIVYIMHATKYCQKIINWIKENMTPSRQLQIDINHDIDRGDSEGLYRNEIEWEGLEYNRIELTIMRNGKKIKEAYFSSYDNY